MKRFLEGLKYAAAILLWTTAFGLIAWGILCLYKQTLSPWWLFLYVNFRDSLYWPLSFLALIFWITFPDKKERMEPDWREKHKAGLGKGLKIWGIAVAVYLVAVNLFPVSREFCAVRLQEKKPSRFSYKAAILKDALAGETRVARGTWENVRADGERYSFRVSTGRHTYGTRSAYAYFLAFRDGDVSYQSYLAEGTAVSYYELTEKASQKKAGRETERICEKEYMIEYYPNSGLVKAIDGCSPYDGDGLQVLLEAFRAQVAAEEERREQEAEAARKENTRQTTIFLDLMHKGTGRDFSEILSDLEKAKVSIEYKVIYLSTYYYEPGQVAFFDQPNRTVYVVADQEQEEMVEVPYFDAKGSVDNIEKALQEAGITYEIQELDPGEGDASKKKLNSYYCGPGTLIPRAFTYWFSIR